MGLIARLFTRLATRAARPPLSEVQLEGEVLARALEGHPGFRVLRALDQSGNVDELALPQDGEQVGVVVDTETTGLDPLQDRLIEIATQRFLFTVTGEIRQIERVRYWLEDPERPLPALIRRLTGLTDDDLRDKLFDTAAITTVLGEAAVVIAHNAAFDRPFLDVRFPGLRYQAWACSLTQLDWPALGFEGRSLAHLVMQSGRFFVGHRASNDVLALTSLLETSATDERTILSHLLERCMLDSFRMDAVGAPFYAKDVLKAHGYRWNSDRRFWSREVGIVDVAEETEWLDQRVYRGRGTPNLQRVTPGERFAARADR